MKFSLLNSIAISQFVIDLMVFQMISPQVYWVPEDSLLNSGGCYDPGTCELPCLEFHTSYDTMSMAPQVPVSRRLTQSIKLGRILVAPPAAECLSQVPYSECHTEHRC